MAPIEVDDTTFDMAIDVRLGLTGSSKRTMINLKEAMKGETGDKAR